MPYDSLIISDIHLGNPLCRAEALQDTLEQYHTDWGFHRLIINGDAFDDFRMHARTNGKKLPETHWRLLSYIRYLSTCPDTQVIWIEGNHDRGLFETASRLTPGVVARNYAWRCGSRLYLAIHGHQFDEFITDKRSVTSFMKKMRSWAGSLDKKNAYFARLLQQDVIKYMHRNAMHELPQRALAYAEDNGIDDILCGHTHIPVEEMKLGGVAYHNSGSWVKTPSSFLTTGMHGVELHMVQ